MQLSNPFVILSVAIEGSDAVGKDLNLTADSMLPKTLHFEP
jgi:hypothetical protein